LKYDVINSETGHVANSGIDNEESAHSLAKKLNRGTDVYRVVTEATTEELNNKIVPERATTMQFQVVNASGEILWSFDTFTEAYYAWKYETEKAWGAEFEIRMGE
jgi:hypothetical protein